MIVFLGDMEFHIMPGLRPSQIVWAGRTFLWQHGNKYLEIHNEATPLMCV